eukprot:5620179-Alexandrium_andersonii.AAC.1
MCHGNLGSENLQAQQIARGVQRSARLYAPSHTGAQLKARVWACVPDSASACWQRDCMSEQTTDGCEQNAE